MAIAYRDGTHSGATSGTTATLTMPVAAVIGDVAIVVLVINANKSASLVSTSTAFVNLGNIAADSNATYSAWRRVIQSGDAGSDFTWTWTTSDGWGLANALYSGVDNTTPEDATTPNFTMESSTAPTSTTVTTVTDNAWAIAVVGIDGANSITAPTGYESRVEREAIGGGHKSVAIADKIITPAGATGAVDWAINGSNTPNGATHIVLRPAAGATQKSPLFSRKPYQIWTIYR